MPNRKWEGITGQKCTSPGCGNPAVSSKIKLDRNGRRIRKLACQRCMDGLNTGTFGSKRNSFQSTKE